MKKLTMSAIIIFGVILSFIGQSFGFTFAHTVTSGENSKLNMAILLSTSATLPYGTKGDIYIAAFIPTGEWFFLTGKGWFLLQDGVSLAPYEKNTVISYKEIQILQNADVSGLPGTQIYVGLDSGGVFYVNIAGTIWPNRQLAPVNFPFKSGVWGVSRYVDKITDVVSCSLNTSQPVGSGTNSVNFYFYKNVGKAVSLSAFIYGTYTGTYIDTANASSSILRVDSNPALSLFDIVSFRSDTLAMPATLYGNYDPMTTEMVNGNEAILRFVSLSSYYSYDLSIPLAGFLDAVNAFDYCISTQ